MVDNLHESSTLCLPNAPKVLYVTMRFPRPSEAFAAVEIRALCRAGAEVSVECLRWRPENCNSLIESHRLTNLPLGHNTIRSNARGLLYGLSRPDVFRYLVSSIFRCAALRPLDVLRSLLLAPRILELYSQIEKDRPDVVHLFWGHYPSLLGLLVQRFSPSVAVSLFLGAYDLGRNYRGSGELARRAAIVWTHTEANSSAIRELGVDPSRIVVCHRGIELNTNASATTGKIPGRILAVERLIPSKHTKDTILAFAALQKTFPHARLVILGDGPERLALTQMVSDLRLSEVVQLLGFVSHDEVFRQMLEAEILVSMSRHPSERLPNVVKEAMARCCVPVVTWSLGIEELIDDSVDGFVIPHGKPDIAAERIGKLLLSRELRLNLAQHAREKVADKFDVDALTQYRLQVWSKALRLLRANNAVSNAIASCNR